LPNNSEATQKSNSVGISEAGFGFSGAFLTTGLGAGVGAGIGA
jgi:hypothetical protein